MNTKQEIIDWLVNNESTVKELMNTLNQYMIVSNSEFDEDANEQLFQETKSAIIDEVSRNKGLPSEEFYDKIEDKELKSYLEKICQ